MPEGVQDWLIVPVEIKVRELDAKLLLAAAACQEGMRVVLGERYAVEGRLADLPRGTYLGKDVTRSVERLYRQVRGLGHRVAAVDEEALVYYSREIYRQRRWHPRTVRSVAALFAWGEDNAEMWRDSEGGESSAIFATGNPRSDLLREEFRGLYGDRVRELRARYGDLVLVNTNFGHVNHFVPKFQKMPDPRRIQETLRARKGRLPHFYDADLAAHRHAIFREFRAMLPDLARALPDTAIVLRPHPSENTERWREWLADLPNATVVHEGPVTPWILASRVLVHNGCSTGIEAAQLGVPAITYRPLRDERYEAALPNDVSVEATRPDALVQAVRRALAGEALEDPRAARARETTLAAHLAVSRGELAVQRIVAALRALPAASPPAGARRMAAWLGLRRRALKAARRQRRMRSERRAWREHTFPRTPASEVQERLATLGGIMDARLRLRVTELGPNLFQIEREA